MMFRAQAMALIQALMQRINQEKWLDTVIT
jgi:hypothetical protein